MKLRNLIILACSIHSLALPQLEKVEFKPNPTKQVDFGDLGAGPYQKLVIRNAMVIPRKVSSATNRFESIINLYVYSVV